MSLSDNHSLPTRLLKNGRDKVEKFEKDEKLYHRYSDMSASNGKLYPNSIRFPDFSVNRSKFSEPEDVLLHDYPKFINWGIVSYKVFELPKPINTGNKKEKTTYSFCVEHEPLEENYSHSEIRTKKNGEYSKTLKVKSKEVKTKFRIHMANILTIEKKAIE